MASKNRRPTDARGNPKTIRTQVAEMAIAVANEPSVGMCFIQQHVQHSTPLVMSLEQELRQSAEDMNSSNEEAAEAAGLVRGMKTYGPASCDRIQGSMDRCLPLLAALAKAKKEKNRTEKNSGVKQPLQAPASMLNPTPGLFSMLSKAVPSMNLVPGSRMNTAPAAVGETEGKKASLEASVLAAVAGGAKCLSKGEKASLDARVQGAVAGGEKSLNEGSLSTDGALNTEVPEGGLPGKDAGSEKLLEDDDAKLKAKEKEKEKNVSEFVALKKAQMEFLQQWLEEAND